MAWAMTAAIFFLISTVKADGGSLTKTRTCLERYEKVTESCQETINGVYVTYGCCSEVESLAQEGCSCLPADGDTATLRINYVLLHSRCDAAGMMSVPLSEIPACDNGSEDDTWEALPRQQIDEVEELDITLDLSLIGGQEASNEEDSTMREGPAELFDPCGSPDAPCAEGAALEDDAAAETFYGMAVPQAFPRAIADMAAEALGRLFGESSIGAVWVEGGEPEDGPEPSAQVAVAVVDEEDWPFALPGQDEGGWEADDGDERPVAPALADEDDLLEGEDLYWEGLDYEEVVAQGDSMDIAIAAAGEAAPRVAEPSAAKATHWVWQTEDEDDFEPCDSCEELWGLAKYLRSEAHRLDDEAGDESEQEGEEEWEEEGEEYTEEGALARAEAAPPSGGADELTVTLEADEDEDVVIALENDSGDDIEVEVTDDSVHEHVVATLPHGSWALIHSTADSDHHLSMDVMPSVGRNQIEQRPENKDRDEWEDLDEIVIEEYVDTEVDTSDADIVINLDTLLGDEKPSALDSQYNGHVFKVEVDVQKITEPQPYAGADPYKLIDYLQEYVHRLENVLMLVYAFICVALVAILFYIYQLYAAVFPAARDDDVYDEESIDGSAQDMTLFEAAKNQINVVLATDYIQSESSPDAGYYVPLADTDKSKQ